MNGIDKVAARIVSDAQQEAAAMKAEAQTRSAELKDAADRHAAELRKTLLNEGEGEAEKQYALLMEIDGVALEDGPAALEAIADKAVEMEIGARGLRSIMEGIMTDVMYRVPSDKSIRRVIITADCVLNGAEPTVIRETGGEIPA